jgi:hypothetical protein
VRCEAGEAKRIDLDAGSEWQGSALFTSMRVSSGIPLLLE